MNEKLLPPNMSEVTSSNIIDTDCSSRDLADLVSSETVLADRHCVPLSHTIPIVDMRESTDADSSTKTLSEQMECIDLHPDPIVEGPTPHNIDDLGISQMGDDPKPNPGVTSVSTPLTPGTSGDQADRSDALRHAVLDAVAKSDAHFRHQQRGEPDLTFDEKWEIAAELLDRKPAIFLSRFGKHISSENAAYFEPLKHDYVIDFHLKEIEKLHNDKKNRTVVRNRRYEAMKKLVEGGDYFSDETMKHRDPLLYEQMVGQYLTEDEVAASIDKSDLTFSSILMSHIQMQYDNVLYNRQRDIEVSHFSCQYTVYLYNRQRDIEVSHFSCQYSVYLYNRQRYRGEPFQLPVYCIPVQQAERYRGEPFQLPVYCIPVQQAEI